MSKTELPRIRVDSRLDNIIQYPSPNFNSRHGQRIKFLILHYTVDDKEAALRRLTDPKAEVSSHYLVDEEGELYQLVDEANRAWHAGYGSWGDYTDINSVSIGIEIVNPGNAPFASAQMDRVREISLDVVQRRAIEPMFVLAHSDVADTPTNHKSDPGWFFDWESLAKIGVGVGPKPIQSDYDTSAAWSDDDVIQNLINYGYGGNTPRSILVEAFQRHFQQEVAKTPQKIGVADVDTRARLAYLLRFKSAGVSLP